MIKSILRNIPSAHHNATRMSSPATRSKEIWVKVHIFRPYLRPVVLHELTEDADADIEGNDKRDVVEQAKTWGYECQLAFGQSCAGSSSFQLLFLKSEIETV